MPLSVEMFLDDETEKAVRHLWAAIAAGGICDYMSTSGSRPHISLGVFDAGDEGRIAQMLDRLSGTAAPPRIRLSAHGRFPGTRVFFLAPSPTRELLAIQESVHGELDGLGVKVWPNYAPGEWYPHCTLAMNAADNTADRLEALVDRAVLPKETRIESMGLVRFRPVFHVAVHALRGPDAPPGPPQGPPAA